MRGLACIVSVLTLLIVTGARAQMETVEGTWVGSWKAGGTTGGLEMRLTQTGEGVGGAYDADGATAGALRGLRVHGTFKDNRLVLKTYDGWRTFDGQLKGNTIAGTYAGRHAIKSFVLQRR